MKTKINTLLGAALSLLVTFAFTHSAAAQSTARIAFTGQVTDRKGQTTWQILAMNSDGTGVTQLTKYGGAWPRWTSDQKYVAFSRCFTSGVTIYVMDAAKGELKGGRIFPVVQSDGSGLDWAPDNSAIVYIDAVGNGLWFVSVNPATGAVGTPVLLRQGTFAMGAPRFSPDGTKIAYHSGGIVRVLDLTTGAEISFPPWSNNGPSWSPDGSKIAFGGVVCYGSTTNCHLEVVIANPDGTGWTPVTALQSYTSFPAWSPNGQELVFYSQVSGSKAMYKTTIGSGTVSLLYNGAELGADWAP